MRYEESTETLFRRVRARGLGRPELPGISSPARRRGLAAAPLARNFFLRALSLLRRQEISPQLRERGPLGNGEAISVSGRGDEVKLSRSHFVVSLPVVGGRGHADLHRGRDLGGECGARGESEQQSGQIRRPGQNYHSICVRIAIKITTP